MKTDKNLQDGSNRVYYEYWMLQRLTEFLDRKLSTDNDTNAIESPLSLNSTGIIRTYSTHDRNRIVTNNAMIESFGIHARALLDFFYGLEVLEKNNRKPHADDIFAEDFFSDKEHWRKIRPQIPDNFDSIRKRVNKEIAHIIVEGAKVKPESKIWLFERIKTTIENAYIIFENQALKERLGTRWNSNGFNR